MEPMSDRDLDELLASWPAPDVPGNLERRMLDSSGSSWRSWLLRGTIQVPVPVAAIAMCLITLLFGWAIVTPKQVNSRAERSAGLQPVKRLEIHIVRSNYESAR